MHEGGNGGADDDADSRWMSYAELAETRRITTASAIRLVLRRGWRRQADNQGAMRALVPLKWSEPAAGKDADPGGHFSRALAALEASVVALRERAESAEHAVRAERERADRAEVASRAELSRGNFLRDRIDTLRADLADAAYDVETAHRAARQAAETAETFHQADARWRALGLLGRIREAWRNRPLTQAGED
jgi:hypothetical protein